MTCERHGGNAGSIMCRECDLETIERYAMTTPTPRTDAIVNEMRGSTMAAKAIRMTDHARQLERDLAAAKDTISKYHERIISQHAQIDDLKWSLWKIEGKHKAAILEVITKLSAAQEARNAAVAEASRWQNSFHAMTERAQAAEAERDAFAGHAGAMRLWIGSQAWKVDEETTREAGLALVMLFDAYRAAHPKDAP